MELCPGSTGSRQAGCLASEASRTRASLLRNTWSPVDTLWRPSKEANNQRAPSFSFTFLFPEPAVAVQISNVRKAPCGLTSPSSFHSPLYTHAHAHAHTHKHAHTRTYTHSCLWACQAPQVKCWLENHRVIMSCEICSSVTERENSSS